MKKTAFWVIAFLITASTAVFQRMTGPTNPISGKTSFEDAEIRFRLQRSHETTSDYEIRIPVPDSEVEGTLMFRRYKTQEPWTRIAMTKKEGTLRGTLPKQPPAGKLEYTVILSSGENEMPLTGEKPVVIRFKDPVPAAILIPHVIIIFLAMVFSTRAGIEALNPGSNPRRLALWTLGLLIVGGFIFGPLVQKYAFGQLWTGFPLGYDLTDNKTLIAVIGWTAAVIASRRQKSGRWWVLGASVLLLIVFLIPHSLLGSELDYSQLEGVSTSSEQTAALKAIGAGFPPGMGGSSIHCATASTAA